MTMTPTPTRPEQTTPTREDHIAMLDAAGVDAHILGAPGLSHVYRTAANALRNYGQPEQRLASEPAGLDLASIKLGAYYEDIEAGLRRVAKKSGLISALVVPEVMAEIFGGGVPTASVPVTPSRDQFISAFMHRGLDYVRASECAAVALTLLAASTGARE